MCINAHLKLYQLNALFIPVWKLESIEIVGFIDSSRNIEYLVQHKCMYGTLKGFPPIILWNNKSSKILDVTVPYWGGQRSTLWYQRRGADAWGRRTPLDLQMCRWCAGSVWERPGWRRGLWPAAPLRGGPPGDGGAARASGAGNTRRTCRLWQTPVLNGASLSANTKKGTF